MSAETVRHSTTYIIIYLSTIWGDTRIVVVNRISTHSPTANEVLYQAYLLINHHGSHYVGI